MGFFSFLTCAVIKLFYETGKQKRKAKEEEFETLRKTFKSLQERNIALQEEQRENSTDSDPDKISWADSNSNATNEGSIECE